MTKHRQIPSAYTQGWVLCSPAGRLQPATFRRFRSEAIAAKFRVLKSREERWAEAEAKGWTVRYVYVRFFVPVFKSTYSSSEISEACE